MSIFRSAWPGSDYVKLSLLVCRHYLGQKRIDITDKDISGFKYFEKLKPLFARLHDVGCVRDKSRHHTDIRVWRSNVRS